MPPSLTPTPAPVVVLDVDGSGRARSVARRLGLELCAGAAAGNGLCLQVSATSIALAGADGISARVDFAAGRAAHRQRFGGGRRQALARALGLTRGIERVLDATAGFGRDAFVLAGLGAGVTLIERSTVVALLLEDGLARARQVPAAAAAADRMRLVCADATDYLAGLSARHRPQAIYLDPMYPPGTKSALAKKEMQLLQRLLGAESDAAGLLGAALRVATRRVVVKRPRRAAPLGGRPADARVLSPNTRYDIYLPDGADAG